MPARPSFRRFTHPVLAVRRRERVGPLACVVARRVIDTANRLWTVREIPEHTPRAVRAARAVGLFFRCDEAGVTPEVRTSQRRLEMLTADDLVRLLQRDVPTAIAG